MSPKDTPQYSPTDIYAWVQDGKLIQQKAGPFGSLKDAQAPHDERGPSLPAGNEPSGRAKSLNPCVLQRVRQILHCSSILCTLLLNFQECRKLCGIEMMLDDFWDLPTEGDPQRLCTAMK